ncbi:Transcriptional activator spt7 [Tulasnella sp. UAMH 9824]|nr:Transcriptional activator spt7 [Tulasnella sp. UAMH 9824]
MKHLLKALEGRLNLQASGTELNQLLTDIRDSKVEQQIHFDQSKLLCVAHDSRHSENFNDTLEKVLEELRSTEHAEPFLKRVNKAIAPDYYDVIKHPMDLGSMSKNIKSGKYKNKADFANDLNLIWDNCLTYNSRPDHPIRRQALYMRKKADHILQRITDKNERPQAVNVRHYKPPPAQHYSKSRTIESSDEEDAGTPLANGRIGHQPNGVMVNGTHGKQVNGITSAPGMANGITATDGKKSTVLGKRRFVRPDDTPFLDRPALIRTPESMATFRDVDIEMQRYMDSEGAGPSRPSPANAVVRHDLGQRVHKKLKTVVAEEPQFQYSEHLGLPLPPPPSDAPQPAYQDPFGANGEIGGVEVTLGQVMGEWWQAMADPSLQMAGLPTLPQSADVTLPSSRVPRTSAKKKTKRPKRSAADKTPVPALRGTIERNISTLRRMRKIHSRVNALQAGEEPRRRSPSPPDISHRSKRARKGRIPLEGGEPVAKHKMNIFGSMLLEHAGFEGASKAALNVLTAAAADYMMNLGKTLRLYADKHGQQMTPEEIILHTLFENGTMEVQELERYIKEDVERYGNKITELEKKLSQAYREVEIGPIDDALASDRDALVAGGWGDDLGIDMLGFKEMGLEAELGITAGAIPMRLFWGKKRIGAAAAVETSAEPPPQYPPPPAFIPLSPSSIDVPIGLLQPFYKERFEKLGASAAAPGPDGSIPAQSPSVITLSDDPPDPSKVKIGPIGHITIPAASSKPKLPKAPAPPKGPAKKKGSGDDVSGGPAGEGAPPSQQASNPAPAAPLPAPTAQPNGTPAPPPGNNPSPAKRKTKAGKKKATGNGPEAPQAGPMVALVA